MASSWQCVVNVLLGVVHSVKDATRDQVRPSLSQPASQSKCQKKNALCILCVTYFRTNDICNVVSLPGGVFVPTDRLGHHNRSGTFTIPKCLLAPGQAALPSYCAPRWNCWKPYLPGTQQYLSELASQPLLIFPCIPYSRIIQLNLDIKTKFGTKQKWS